MKLEPFSMYDAVQGIPDVRHLVAILFGSTVLAFIKAVLEKSGYPFGSEETWVRQLRDIHSQWSTRGKTLDGIRGYMGMVDPFNELERSAKMNKGQPFQFLYYLSIDDNNNYDPERYRTRIVSALCIEDACAKFMARRPKTLVKVDYEVKTGTDDFIDISEIAFINEFI